jgi:hypothetical protein
MFTAQNFSTKLVLGYSIVPANPSYTLRRESEFQNRTNHDKPTATNTTQGKSSQLVHDV